MSIKVTKITNGNVYIDGGNLIGRAKEIELPKISQKMSDHEGLGMVGMAEFVAGVDKLEAKIMWNSYYPDAMAAAGNPSKSVQLQIRANGAVYEGGGLSANIPIVVHMTGVFKSLGLGTFKQHENVESETEISVYYVRVEIDGVNVIEYDVTANIYKVNGEDILAEYRTNIGA